MVVQEINYKRGLLEKKLFSSNFPAINLHLNHVHWGISRFSIFDYQKGSHHGTDQDPRGQIGSFVIYEITILGESTSSNIQHHPASTSYDLGYSLGFWPTRLVMIFHSEITCPSLAATFKPHLAGLNVTRLSHLASWGLRREILLKSLGFSGISWDSMKFHGIQWNSMGFNEIPWDSVKFHGIQWNSMGFNEIP